MLATTWSTTDWLLGGLCTKARRSRAMDVGEHKDDRYRCPANTAISYAAVFLKNSSQFVTIFISTPANMYEQSRIALNSPSSFFYNASLLVCLSKSILDRIGHDSCWEFRHIIQNISRALVWTDVCRHATWHSVSKCERIVCYSSCPGLSIWLRTYWARSLLEISSHFSK